MTLVNRVSAFFLLALAIALIGFSSLLCTLVYFSLHRQFSDQLHSALNTLVAAVEVEDDDVKWEPSDHTIALGSHNELDDLRWAVFDEQGQIIDHSRNLSPAQPADAALLKSAHSLSAHHDGSWTFLHAHLAAPHPKAVAERSPQEFSELLVAVARSSVDVQSSLRRLIMLVAGLSLATWLAAATVGHWYCRKALAPVQAMAAHARGATEADFRMRLPVTEGGDELSDLGLAFNQLLGQLQQAFDRQRRFTADAAHQLRTPLTVLFGQIDVLLRRPRTQEEYCQTLGVLREQTVDLQQIVETLLFLARPEADSAPPTVEPGDLAEWLPRHLARYQQNARWPDLKINAAGELALTTNWPLLGQLVDILLANALKYSLPGTPVTITAERQAGQVQLRVTDRGIGIRAEDREAIFEPFFRSSAARQSGAAGTGLGLAIAARIAATLNGQLTCSSTSGAGSEFAFLLPSA